MYLVLIKLTVHISITNLFVWDKLLNIYIEVEINEKVHKMVSGLKGYLISQQYNVWEKLTASVPRCKVVTNLIKKNWGVGRVNCPF